MHAEKKELDIMDLSRDTTKPYLSGLPDKSNKYCCLEASLMHHMTLHIESWHKLPLKISCVREWAELAVSSLCSSLALGAVLPGLIACLADCHLHRAPLEPR